MHADVHGINSSIQPAKDPSRQGTGEGPTETSSLLWKESKMPWGIAVTLIYIPANSRHVLCSVGVLARTVLSKNE